MLSNIEVSIAMILCHCEPRGVVELCFTTPRRRSNLIFIKKPRAHKCVDRGKAT